MIDPLCAHQAFTNLLRVEEGGGAFVTEEHLLVRDRDSQEEALRVEVQRVAHRGRLELVGRTLLQGDEFTLSDLRGLRLRCVCRSQMKPVWLTRLKQAAWCCCW